MTTRTSKGSAECCMCGDCGFSNELYQCKVCQFRSQHSYCSNQYPNAESYKICNWCLIQKEETKEKSPNSSGSSSSHERNTATGYGSNDHGIKIKKKINGCAENIGGKVKGSKKGIDLVHLQVNNPVKNHIKTPPASPSPRKRITNASGMDKRLRRTKSGDIPNVSGGVGINKQQVFRSKVRRYKLLEEVSS